MRKKGRSAEYDKLRSVYYGGGGAKINAWGEDIYGLYLFFFQAKKQKIMARKSGIKICQATSANFFFSAFLLKGKEKKNSKRPSRRQ